MTTTNLSVMPTQWARFDDIEDVEPLNDGDYACLAEVAAVLQKHGKRERFGVTLLHKHFEVEADEELVETTNVRGRTLTITPQKAGDDAGQDGGDLVDARRVP